MTVEPLPTVAARRRRPKTPIIDSDVHSLLPSAADISPYISERYREVHDVYGLRRPSPIGYFATVLRTVAARADSHPPGGGPPGSDLDFMREQLLDQWDMERAVLNPIYQLYFGEELGQLALELTRGLNNWTIEEWLEREERFSAAICVPYEEPDLAVEEVHRLGSDDRFVHVLFNVPTHVPLGNRKYWPIFEAAVEHDLPIAVHVGGVAGNCVSGTGWPSSYYEFHSGFAQAFQDELINLVFSGVFQRFPNLKFVFAEGGFGWLPPLMWRMDRAWWRLRAEVSHVDRLPSDYVREHFWFTTQPIEEPERPEDFNALIEEIGSPDRLLFSSDYPHWDFDAPDLALPPGIDPEWRRGIMAGNARALYGLPEPEVELGPRR